jgi:PAS domain S-box-containing protein
MTDVSDGVVVYRPDHEASLDVTAFVGEHRAGDPNIVSASGSSKNDSCGQDQALYRFLVDSLTEYAVFAVSPSGVVMSWNAGAEQTFGFTQAEIIGRSFEIIFTSEDARAGAPQNELDSALSGVQTQHDRWHVRKDGSRFWGTNTVQPLYDAAGKLLGFTKLVRDTTLNHVALEELSDSEQQLRLLVESEHDYAIFSVALDGTVTSWNAGAQKVFGYEQTDMIGRNFSNLFTAEDVVAGSPLAELHEATIKGFANVECCLKRKDGSRFRASGKLNQLKRDAAGELRGFVKIVHDITEQDAAYQHERKWSTTFQRAVLPLHLPEVTGLKFDALYEPGLADAQVGGDWYDAVRLLDGRVLVTIGDVGGRGLEAAVVVGVVRQIMRGIAQLHADPALVLDAADRALAVEYPDVYVTAWVGVLDLVMRTITYSCAGHPPTLLAAADGSVRELGSPALPIGLREGVRGESDTVSWSNGDTLILYTDGLTEATHDVLTGIEQLYKAARQLGTSSWQNPAEEIKRVAIPAGSVDDVAILVLRVDFARFEQHVDRWHLDANDAAAATALRMKFTASLAHRDFSSEDIANAELVFGELIGNVVRHTRGDCQVDIVIDHSGPRIVLHILDSGAGFSYVSRLVPDPYCESGRGLFLIAALTADFEVDQRPDGGSHARAVLRGRFPSLLREFTPKLPVPSAVALKIAS